MIEGVGTAEQDFKYGYVGAVPWMNFQSTLVSNGNNWWNANNNTPFTIPVPKPGTAVNLAGWQTGTGQDAGSTFMMPSLSLSSVCAVTADAPDWQLLVDSGTATADSTGKATFNLTGVDLGGFSASATFAVDGVTAIPGATVQFATPTIGIPGTAIVTFIAGPQTPGGMYTFTVLANSGNTTRTLALTVTVANQVLTISPATLTYPAQVVGTTSSAQAVTVTNASSSQVSISSINASSGFSQTNNCPSILSAGKSCIVNVMFSPQSVMPYSGLLTIAFPQMRQQGISLSGTGM